MSQNIKYIITGAFLTLFLISCSKKLVIINPEKLERRKTPELVHTLDSLFLLRPTFFYSKISTQFQDTNQNVSFKTSIRMVKDSATNALITYAAIPIFNTMLTRDSLTILNKRNKCYSKSKLSSLKDNFGYDFEYKNIEEIILGLPVAYDTNQKYFQIHDPFNYILSSHRKKEIKRNDRPRPNRRNETNDIIIKYFLTVDAKGLKKMEIESPDDSTQIFVEYISRELVDNFNIPKEVTVNVKTPRNNILVNLTYEKIEINQPQPLFLVIPENYEICE
jgi:hypothetical protein